MRSSKGKTEKKKWKRLSKQQAHALWLNKVEIRYTNGKHSPEGIWGTCYGPMSTGTTAATGVWEDCHKLYRFWVEVE